MSTKSTFEKLGRDPLSKAKANRKKSALFSDPESQSDVKENFYEEYHEPAGVEPQPNERIRFTLKNILDFKMEKLSFFDYEYSKDQYRVSLFRVGLSHPKWTRHRVLELKPQIGKHLRLTVFSVRVQALNIQ